MKVKKYLNPSGSLIKRKRRLFYFTPEQEKLFNLVTVPGTNANSNTTDARKTGVQALNFLAQEAARKDAEIEARSDRKTVKRLTTVGERLRGDNGYSSYMSAGTPMSGRDPALGTIFDWTVGAKGIDTLGKTALWNFAKYGPSNLFRGLARNYFINNAFKLELRKPILFGVGEILQPQVRTKVGDVEIDNPGLYYHQSGVGKALHFMETGRMRTPTEELWLAKEAAGEHIPIMLRTGIKPGYPQVPGRAMFSLGRLWYGLDPKRNPDLLVTAREMPIANKHASIMSDKASLRSLENQGSRRVTDDNIYTQGPHNRQNIAAYTWKPGYGYKLIVEEPSTSLAFFERGPSRISLAERLGIPKGDRGNLNLFQKDALEDLEQYINSGLYRLLPTINMETAEPSWVPRRSAVSALRLLIDDGVPNSGRNSWAWNRPNGGTYELVTDGNGNFGIGYNSYRMFDISPEFNVRVGEASAGSARNGYSKIFLTAPKNDARHLITETPEQELAKKTLIETQSPRISKDIMRDFWSGVLLSLRPGAYLSGDEGMLPKGSTLIRQFKELFKKGYRRDNNGNIIGSGRTNWEDIRNSLMRPEKWKRREDGLSTDSYLALLKQANRENSPYYLRYSPDGFTTFNSQSIDNKFISDLLEKTKTGEATQLEFLDAFHNWVSPYGGMDARIVNGEIVIPHPFLYKKKQGGNLTINNTDI